MPVHCITGGPARPYGENNVHNTVFGQMAGTKTNAAHPQSGLAARAWYAVDYLPAGLSPAALSCGGTALRNRFSRSLRIFSGSRPDGEGVGVGFGVFIPLRYHRHLHPGPLTLQMSLPNRHRAARSHAHSNSAQTTDIAREAHSATFFCYQNVAIGTNLGGSGAYKLSPLVPLRCNYTACSRSVSGTIWPGGFGRPMGFPPGPAPCLRQSAVRGQRCWTRHSPSPS